MNVTPTCLLCFAMRAWHPAEKEGSDSRPGRHEVKTTTVERKGPLSTLDNGPSQVGMTGRLLNFFLSHPHSGRR